MWHAIAMPKQIDYKLTENEQVVVRQAIARDKRPEMRHRATSTALCPVSQAGQRFGARE
jgi:hypothetical protein